MVDIAVVMDGLEKCADGKCNADCPYSRINYNCRPQLMLDALKLLKEQQDGLKHYDDGSVEP